MNEVLNECNGEPVDVQGTMHVVENTTTDANGSHFHVSFSLADVKGIAPLTGARYVETDTAVQSSNFSFDGASEVTDVETRVLNRLGEDGTLDDFLYHLSAHMTVNANGVLTVDRTESRIDCR